MSDLTRLGEVITDLRAELAAARAEAQQLRESLAITDSTVASLEGLERLLRERLQTAEAENARLRSELEAVQAESDKWFAIAAAEQDVKALLDRNVKLRKWLESSDGMMANYERLASKYRTERDALQARLAQAVAALETCQWGNCLHDHVCPSCGREREHGGHADDCAVALALLRGTEAGK